MILPSGLPEEVADGEPLARFLTSSGQFNKSAVKQSAFLPNKKDGKTSVFRHGAEPQSALITIANEHIGGDRRVHGAGIIRASDVRAVQLDVQSQEPPPRHADITNWPPWMEKARQKEIAILLAQKAELVLFPQPEKDPITS